MAQEIATVDESTGEIIDATPRTTRGLVNTLHPQSFEERKAAFNAVNNATSLDDMGEKHVSIIAIVQAPGVRADRNGGPDQPCTNTTLVGADGKGYFTQSEGIARSAYNLVATFGVQWPEPLEVHVKKTQLANKNTLKTLVVD